MHLSSHDSFHQLPPAIGSFNYLFFKGVFQNSLLYNFYWLLGNCGTACRIQKIGGQWGAIPKHEKGRNQYEIDIVTLDEESKEIGFFECRYSTLKFKVALDIIAELKKKSRCVDWNTSKRKEHFGVIAKKIADKERLRKEGYFVFDFDDF